MDATNEFWQRTAFNATEVFHQEFRVISVDVRNAGNSSGPIVGDDPWRAYAEDHLGLMNHHGIEEFSVLGCCIGSSHALKLIELAPRRVRCAVLEQPTGLDATSFDPLWKLFGDWAREQCRKRTDVNMEMLEAFGRKMWHGDFVMSVSRDFVRACSTPMLVLPGTDLYHPGAVGREVAALAPNAQCHEPWKLPADLVPGTVARIKAFLHAHAG